VSTERRDYDVSGLPHTVFGHRNLLFWGTTGFMVIEGTTLVLLASSYIYLWQNFERWPPATTALPPLLLPTLSLAFLLLSNVPAMRLKKAGEAMDAAATRRWLLVCLLCAAGWVALRSMEMSALNTRWDDNAYGSAMWALVFAHFTLLAVEFLEVLLLAAIFWSGRAEEKHFPDVSEVAMYWYFVTLIWIPGWLLLFVLPRFI
jgi:heme/copper-type cytochrome/quinol oxidase subunit 3